MFAVELPVPVPKYNEPSPESQNSQLGLALVPMFIYPSVPMGIGPLFGIEKEVALLCEPILSAKLLYNQVLVLEQSSARIIISFLLLIVFKTVL